MNNQEALNKMCAKCRFVDECVNSEDGEICEEYITLLQALIELHMMERAFDSIRELVANLKGKN